MNLIQHSGSHLITVNGDDIGGTDNPLDNRGSDNVIRSSESGIVFCKTLGPNTFKCQTDAKLFPLRSVTVRSNAEDVDVAFCLGLRLLFCHFYSVCDKANLIVSVAFSFFSSYTYDQLLI